MNLPVRSWAALVLKMLLAPAALYLAAFALLTWPLITQFPTHLFADRGDGVQNYWNLWWMHRSIVEMHAPFWKTPYLHYPIGTSLLGHTLNPFNGLMAIPLIPFLGLLPAYNFIVVFSFVMGGVTAFWLARHLTRAYWPSILGGAIFTFSAYHFAHAEGHMQLVSLEWLPLFALLWYLAVTRPRPLFGIGAALALFAVLLCDYYYAFFSALLGILVVIWQALRLRRPLFFLSPPYLAPFAAFAALALATSGPVVISLLLLARSDPLTGAHGALENSLDLLAPFIPGGHWRFAELTRGYWSRLPGFIHESSVYLGWSVIGLIGYVWARRGRAPLAGARLWFAALALFLVLGLGPVLNVWGSPVGPYALPYAWLEALLPPLALSGVPVRMMAMVTLAASVIAAAGFKMLLSGPGWGRLAAVLLVAVLTIEYLPRPLPASTLSTPPYVAALAAQKDDKGVLDTVANQTMVLYYQTVHQKPIALGYIARIPKSVADVDFQIRELYDRRDYAKLRREFGIRYVVTQPGFEVSAPGLPVRLLHDGPDARVWDLGE